VPVKKSSRLLSAYQQNVDRTTCKTGVRKDVHGAIPCPGDQFSVG
jgi:hypothetical protein